MTFATRSSLFAAYSVCVILVNLPVVRRLAEMSAEVGSSHLPVIPLITLALIYRARRVIFSEVRFGSPLGVALIAVGFIASSAAPLGLGEHAVTVRVALAVLLWLAGFLLFYGPQAFRAAVFPLLFLGLMIPVPATLLRAATDLLTIGTTGIVGPLLAMTGTPVDRDGFVFSLPGFAIEITDACSGLRSTIALMLTGLVAGHLYLSRGWTKAALLFAVLLVSMLKNAIRIVSLVLLSIHVDPGFLQGRLHHDGGIIFFLLALALLAPVLALLRTAERRVGSPPEGRVAPVNR